jgi:phosphate starvation-inducible PhoH-like protein
LPTPPTQGASATDDMHNQVVEFPDNFLLIDLCGAHDRNLAEIERTLDVQILRRGNQLTVHGEAAPVA